MAEAVAPVCFTASETFAKTGFPKCSDPAFLGFVPPTTLVPKILPSATTGAHNVTETDRSQSLAGRGNFSRGQREPMERVQDSSASDSRSLLASETLEYNFRRVVDAEVLCRRSIGRCRGRVFSPNSALQDRPSASLKNLHSWSLLLQGRVR